MIEVRETDRTSLVYLDFLETKHILVPSRSIKGSVLSTSDGYTRDPMIPSPLPVPRTWHVVWVERRVGRRASAQRQPRCQPRPRLSSRRLSAAPALRHEVREEPAGTGGEVGLVVCEPSGRAAGETGDEAAYDDAGWSGRTCTRGRCEACVVAAIGVRRSSELIGVST